MSANRTQAAVSKKTWKAWAVVHPGGTLRNVFLSEVSAKCVAEYFGERCVRVTVTVQAEGRKKRADPS